MILKMNVQKKISDSDDCSIDSYLNDINISLKKINNDELLNKLVNIEIKVSKRNYIYRWNI